MGIVDRARELRRKIEENAGVLTDEEALEYPELYPEWMGDGVVYTAGRRVRCEGKLYTIRQTHISQADRKPGAIGTESLFAVIDLVNCGTSGNPIPYDGNMELMAGMYYTQDGVVYLCTRDTGSPIYHALKDLVGLYVEVA